MCRVPRILPEKSVRGELGAKRGPRPQARGGRDRVARRGRDRVAGRRAVVERAQEDARRASLLERDGALLIAATRRVQRVPANVWARIYFESPVLRGRERDAGHGMRACGSEHVPRTGSAAMMRCEHVCVCCVCPAPSASAEYPLPCRRGACAVRVVTDAKSQKKVSSPALARPELWPRPSRPG